MTLNKVTFRENKKGNYISFSTPYLNEGRKIQINKHINKEISNNPERLSRIINGITEIINSKEYEGYEGFLKAKKNKFDEFAIDAVYGKMEFNSIYYKKHINNLLEEKIMIKDSQGQFYPTITLIGDTGAGKTTLMKKMIGCSSKFPATFQSNSTVGNFDILIDPMQEDFKIVSTFLNKKYIKDIVIELILKSVINLIKIDTSVAGLTEDIIEQIKIDLKESSDRKRKLYTLFDFENTEFLNIISEVYLFYIDIWVEFKKKKYIEVDEVNKFQIFDSYKENISVDNNLNKQYFLANLYEFIETAEKLDEISDRVLAIIIEEQSNLFNKFLNKLEGLKFVMEYIEDDELNIITDKTKEIIKFNAPIELMSLTVIGDVDLDKLFKTLEIISTASKKNQSLLFSLERIRMSGSFLYKKQSNEKYILFDTEGIGHEKGKNELNSGLLEQIRISDEIIWVINGEKPFDGTNEDVILNSLINEGVISRVTCVANRIENLDEDVYEDNKDKEEYIKIALKALFKSLVEKNNDIEVTSLEQEYIQKIIGKMILISDLKRITKNNFHENEGFNKLYNLIYSCEKRDETKKNSEFLELKKLAFEGKLKYSDETFYEKIFELKISYKNLIFERLGASHWQSVKAFNSRMYYNYDYREYGLINPEVILNHMIKYYLKNYLESPENKAKCIRNSQDFLTLIDMLISDFEIATDLSDEIFKLIHLKFKEKWGSALSQSGSGSTKVRMYIIKEIFESILVSDEINKIVKMVMKESKLLNEFLR